MILSLALILVVKFLGGGGTSSGLVVSLSIGNGLSCRRTSQYTHPPPITLATSLLSLTTLSCPSSPNMSRCWPLTRDAAHSHCRRPPAEYGAIDAAFDNEGRKGGINWQCPRSPSEVLPRSQRGVSPSLSAGLATIARSNIGKWQTVVAVQQS